MTPADYSSVTRVAKLGAVRHDAAREPCRIEAASTCSAGCAIVLDNLPTSRGARRTRRGCASLRNSWVALPPLAEQRRIVAKVDELMTLCERLEASLVSGENQRRRLLGALLAEALAPARDADRLIGPHVRQDSLLLPSSRTRQRKDRDAAAFANPSDERPARSARYPIHLR